MSDVRSKRTRLRNRIAANDAGGQVGEIDSVLLRATEPVLFWR